MSEREEMSAEEQERLARDLAEQFRKLRIEDLLIQTLVTVSSLGYRRLGLTEETREDRELEQTRLAIETMRALTPVLEKFVPAELVRDFNQSVANLQLAYAKAAADAGAAAEAGQAGGPQRPDSHQKSDETEEKRRTRDSPSSVEQERNETEENGDSARE